MKTAHPANVMTFLPLLVITVLRFTGVQGSVCCNSPFGQQAW